MIQAKTYTSGADIIAGAMAVRARLWKPGKAVLDNQPVPQKPAPAPIPEEIIEEKKRLQQKQHQLSKHQRLQKKQHLLKSLLLKRKLLLLRKRLLKRRLLKSKFIK